jgi:hypothetical protein
MIYLLLTGLLPVQSLVKPSAVLAPMPRESVRIATAVKPDSFAVCAVRCAA